MAERRTSPEIPLAQGKPAYSIPLRVKPIARTVQAVTASYQRALDSRTTFVTIHAIAQDVYVKWAEGLADACSAANFDEMIPVGNSLTLAIPDKADGTKYSFIAVIGRVGGGTAVIIEK